MMSGMLPVASFGLKSRPDGYYRDRWPDHLHDFDDRGGS